MAINSIATDGKLLNLTAFLEYAQPRVALTKILKTRNTKTFAELLPQVVSILETTPVDDPRARYVNEPGLYRLIARSTMEKAEFFQDWVYEGKELMRLKNASLQELIAGGFGQTGCKLYAIAANHINQAVLGFTQTTTSFKKQQLLPRHISIPDILNMQGQVARCYAETCFQKFVSDNLQHLRGLSEADLVKEFAGLKLNLRQGLVSTDMGDLQSKLLTVAEAKKRKAEIGLQSRKQQKLLQAEQPKTIECAASRHVQLRSRSQRCLISVLNRCVLQDTFS
ncbi:hypothetical protein ABBQ38_006533 [Trebouxia sp. C0009 RCD-2024]